MATISVELMNRGELDADLSRLLARAPGRMKTAMKLIGGKIQNRAIDYAPVSPKLEQVSANLTRGLKPGASTGISINPSTGVISITRTALRSRSGSFGGGKGKNPGALQRSISILGVGVSRGAGAWVEIGVPLNSDAGKYAHYIHDLGPHGGQEWMNRGLGTRAKGPQAGDLFIKRAIDDEHRDSLKIVDATVKRWLKKDGKLSA